MNIWNILDIAGTGGTTRYIYIFGYILEEYQYWLNDWYNIFLWYDIGFLDSSSLVTLGQDVFPKEISVAEVE